MISGVMRLADRTARGLMTPRRDVEILDIEDNDTEIREQLRKTTRSRLSRARWRIRRDRRVLFVKDALDALLRGEKLNLRSIMRDAPVVSDLSGALDVIEALRQTPAHMVLVYDEFGHFEGIVTSGDVLEAITGVFMDDTSEEPAILARQDGSYTSSPAGRPSTNSPNA